jgi:hypothetical protein
VGNDQIRQKRPEFVGLTLHVAMDTASGQGMGVHIFGPPTDLRVAFKADFSPLRLNLLVQDGLVVDAAVG